MKTILLILAVLTILGCSETEPVNEVVDTESAECCAGMPNVVIWDIYPTITQPDVGTARIPVGRNIITITFNGVPCNLRVTNLPDADVFVHYWNLRHTALHIDVTPLSPGKLVHAAVDWHSGGRVLKHISGEQ